MVTAGKVFVVREETDLETIASKLKDFKVEEVRKADDTDVKLITEVSGLRALEETLHGTFFQDQLFTIYRRDGYVPAVKTIEAPFVFSQYKGRILLTVLEKKRQANLIANQLSKILFIATGRVVEARIEPKVMKAFHEQNFEDTKIVFFDGVDIPNVEKLSLYGSGLADTMLYSDYCSHGNVWYVVIKPKKYGFIVGVTRDGVVTIFSKVENDDFVSYVTNEIYPLIS